MHVNKVIYWPRQGRFLGTGSAPLMVLAAPRLSAATVFNMPVDVAASETALVTDPCRGPAKV